MQINLGLLDKLPSLGYSKTIPVFLANKNNYVGQCEIVRSEKGQHLGILTLYQEIPFDYYMYYITSATEIPVFFLTELLFLEVPLRGEHTARLCDNLVQ